MTAIQHHSYIDPEALALGVAKFVCETAEMSIHEKGVFSLVLSGGSTPRSAYLALVEMSLEEGLDWSKVQIFWGDERCVPSNHQESNYRMAQEALLDHVPIPTLNIHRMACETDPDTGAQTYEQVLRAVFPKQPWPTFDLVLLGLGDDGHTASLFPGTDILNERERWVAPVYVPRLDSWRISLTLPAINHASSVAFLVTGAGKASILRQILQPDDEPKQIPAMNIQTEGELHWFYDEHAGSQLSFA